MMMDESKQIQGFNEDEIELKDPNSGKIFKKHKLVLILIALGLSVFIAALDNTIVSTSLAILSTSFNSLQDITWIAASYLLTSTAMQPLYGKFSDIFGRKYIILLALGLFLLGSIGCGTASNVILLIIFRGLCGVGGGGLISISIIVLSDITPMQSRGIYMGLIGAVVALASVVGPLIGGAFSDGLSWRWAFFINIPICIVAMTIVIFYLNIPVRKEGFREKLKRIDYLGSLTLVAATICLVLALNWGGKTYPWNSWQVLSTLIIGIVLSCAFIIIELKYSIEPIIPSHILNKNVISANLSTFFNGFTLMVVIYYIPLYHQVVKGLNATMAGLELLPFLLGLVVTSIFSGIYATKTGNYRILSMIGTLISLLGILTFAFMLRPGIARYEEIIYTLLIGFGIGLCIQTNTITAQCSVKDEEVAIVTSLINFLQSLGGVLGLAIQGAVFSNVLTTSLNQKVPEIDVSLVTSSLKEASNLSPDQFNSLIESYILSTSWIFISLIPFAVLATLFAFLVKHIPFRVKPVAVSH